MFSCKVIIYENMYGFVIEDWRCFANIAQEFILIDDCKKELQIMYASNSKSTNLQNNTQLEYVRVS